MTREALAAYFDHTVLKPETTQAQVRQLCSEAHSLGFAAVCVAPVWVPVAAAALQGSTCKVVGVVGFPHGTSLPEVKALEAQHMISAGARELDMVINIGALKGGDPATVQQDIAAVVRVARARPGVLVKVILETALLSDEEKVQACRLAEIAGADFVKTSTGFGPGGATVRDVRLLRTIVGNRLGVKASGSIQTLASALAMIEAGASRVGSSSSVSIVQELERVGGRAASS